MMAKGIHSFYAQKQGEERSIDYFLGWYEGDHFNDSYFDEKLKRVQKRLIAKLGIGSFVYRWSPSVEKPYVPLSNAQKYKRAVSKAYNIHRKRVTEIIDDNSLFMDDFLKQETERHHIRINELKKRYGQNT